MRKLIFVFFCLILKTLRVYDNTNARVRIIRVYIPNYFRHLWTSPTSTNHRSYDNKNELMSSKISPKITDNYHTNLII